MQAPSFPVDFEKIADNLAQQGYAVADEFLSTHETDLIREADEFAGGMLQFKPAGTGQGNSHRISDRVRGDKIHWLDQATASAPLQTYFGKLNALMLSLNRNLFLSLKSFEVHLTSYPIGAFYRRHLDQFKADDHRKISVICYLNQDWTESLGGQLRIYPETGSVDILPLAGRLVCLRSDQIEHEVLPAKRERLSLTGWMKDTIA